MFELMPGSLIVAYLLFSTFGYYQSWHAKNFAGANQAFGLVLSLSALASMICGLIFWVYYGWTVRWYLPIVLFGISLVVQACWFAIEARLRLRELPVILSLLGFVAWPVAAIWMFRAIP